ncbi:MAG: ABC transporter permease [Oscillospiraceae bacterium]|nr:ABC transporter permease [Oscillospiraceae bacterium]
MIFGMIKYHLLVLIREPINLFFGLGLPFLNLFILSANLEYGATLDAYLPALLVVAAIALCFTDSAASHAYARQIKFLRRLRMTSASPKIYVFTGILSRLGALFVLAAALTAVMVIFFGLSLSHRNWLLFTAMLILVFIMFYLISMFVANALKGAKNSQNLAYVTFFLLLIVGGLMLPLGAMPGVLQTIANNLPPMFAINVLQSAWLGTDIFYGHSFIAVVAITAVFGLLSIKFFKFE